MSNKTAIQWTDVTDNIIVAKINGKVLGWWCRMISPGCLNCYAAKLNLSKYFKGNMLSYSGEAPELHLREEIIHGWARQKKAKRHFVSSMTDVFGEWVPQEWIFKMLDGMAAAPLQTFQVLTKRADVALQQTDAWLLARGLNILPKNIQIGVSVENQFYADLRIKVLVQIRAHVRFLSMEPLLEYVHLGFFGSTSKQEYPIGFKDWSEAKQDAWFRDIARAVYIARLDNGIHWVIAGGESGSNARAVHPAWIKGIREQCIDAGIPFFFKQWGEWVTETQSPEDIVLPGQSTSPWATLNEKTNEWGGDETEVYKVGKKAAGRLLDGREHNGFPAEVQP